MRVPFSPPDISQVEIDLVTETLRSGWITTGPKTKEFENTIASYCNTNKAVCVNSATAAMELVLHLLGVGTGDNVITSAYTYTASASVIFHVGASIKLLDVKEGKYEIDYDAIYDAIDEDTKVIIPVDIAGIPCDYDKIFEIVEAKKNIYKANNKMQEAFCRVVVLSDSAHGFGSSYKGVKTGSLADFTAFSFHAVKNLTVAEGGAITWKNNESLDDEEIYNTLVHLSLHGQTKDALAKIKPGSWEYDIIYPAYKCNMTDIMASIGLAQMKRYESMLKIRGKLVDIYENELKSLPIELIKHTSDSYFSNKHLMLSRLKDFNQEQRNDFITKLAQMGVAANVHYKPLPMLTAYKNLGFHIEDYPGAFATYENEVSLPLFSTMSEEQAMYVCQSIKKILSASE